MTIEIGTQLGNYQLIRQLGRGQFAEVYLGEHVYLKTPVAIKVLKAALTHEDAQRFAAEVRTIVHLEHPHIVHILEYAVADDRPYLVMDYAPNGTLRQRYPRGTHVPLGALAEYVQQIAAALQYSHEQKIIHRDVKPENILFGENDRILLGDFGLSAVVRTGEQNSQELVGTVAYMAPEQLRGLADIASDQYALGIVMYELLSGACPFRGTYVEVATQHALVPPPPLRGSLSDLPLAVEEVIMIALRKDPKQRFGSIKAFAHAFEQASIASQQSKANLVEPLMRKVSVSGAKQVSSVNTIQPAKPDQAMEAYLPTMRSQSRRKFSRRAIIYSLVGVVAVGTIGGGSVLWWENTHRRLAQSPSPTPTLSPPGTLLYTYTGHAGRVGNVHWSPDGTRILSVGEDHVAHIWQVGRGAPGKVIKHPNVQSGIWSRDSATIAFSTTDKKVLLWNATTGQDLITIGDGVRPISPVCWSLDDKSLYTLFETNPTVYLGAPIVKTYDRKTGELLQSSAVKWSEGSSLSPDGKRFVISTSNGTEIQDVATEQSLVIYKSTVGVGSLYFTFWSPDAKYVASITFNGPLEVWDAQTGKVVTVSDDGFRSSILVFSPNDQYVAFVTRSGNEAIVLDIYAGQTTVTYHAPTDVINDISWSPDGKSIASCSNDVKIWQAV